MKGIVFTEFLDTVDEAFGEQVTDRLISCCPLGSGGAYTSVGSYDPQELHTLIGVLSSETSVAISDLQRVFGMRLFGRFRDLYPAFFERYSTAFDMLAAVEDEIHAEVRKLYPDAQLPVIEPVARQKGMLVLRYRSALRLEAFCGGLIEGCLAHFGETASVSMAKGRDAQGVFHDFALTAGEAGRNEHNA